MASSDWTADAQALAVARHEALEGVDVGGQRRAVVLEHVALGLEPVADGLTARGRLVLGVGDHGVTPGLGVALDLVRAAGGVVDQGPGARLGVGGRGRRVLVGAVDRGPRLGGGAVEQVGPPRLGVGHERLGLGLRLGDGVVGGLLGEEERPAEEVVLLAVAGRADRGLARPLLQPADLDQQLLDRHRGAVEQRVDLLLPVAPELLAEFGGPKLVGRDIHRGLLSPGHGTGSPIGMLPTGPRSISDARDPSWGTPGVQIARLDIHRAAPSATGPRPPAPTSPGACGPSRRRAGSPLARRLGSDAGQQIA